MNRILVIGSGGAGKSTLARALAGRLKLPLFHLDQMFWKTGWVESDKADFNRRLTKVLKTRHWIIDGNYEGSQEQRLRFADTVLFLDYGRWTCLWHVVKRYWAAPDPDKRGMAPGCVEKMDLKFLKWVWRFPEASRPAILSRLEKRPKDVWLVRFRSLAEAATFLESL